MPEIAHVLIADDHTLVREGLRLLLDRQPDFRVVAEAENGRDAVRFALEARPDLLLLDISMPVMDGIQALREIRRRLPTVRALMLTMHEDRDLFFRSLQAGAAGYLLKGASSQELLEALRVVMRGEVYLSPRMTTLLVQHLLNQGQLPHPDEPAPQDVLSPRELEVLQRLAEGQTNAEIAAALVISPSTVQTHRARILEKLGLSSRADLVKYALRHGLIGLE